MEIRIIKSNQDTYWYSDRIGEVFKVLAEELTRYRIQTKRPSIGHFYVFKTDCESI